MKESCIHCKKEVYARGVCYPHYALMRDQVGRGKISWYQLVKNGKATKTTRPKCEVKIYEFHPRLIGTFASYTLAGRMLGIGVNKVQHSATRNNLFWIDGKPYKAIKTNP